MNTNQKIAVICLLPAVAGYLGWLFVSGVRSGHAYLPRIGYYSRQLRPASFWALSALTLILAAAFLIGWLFMLTEYLSSRN
jgi:hypothetical protein